ncbi:hypothetical protein AVEN_200418-1 [Araneus ventricosus]|uniref:Uncharacterized protein n=1 Tax=Araneus ventricosus TaxID=182803 RepID=A0A4Y2SNS4_ARAVE|nr:hypothetical protein AVEN_3245-1 [Araneus ventricosus]GBN89982.1 hypothetical protein AVEN_200418-1 [Araneus ventricosus]
MGIVIKEDDTFTQYARVFPSDGFTMAQCLFLFSEIEGTLIWNKVLFKLLIGPGTLIWNWLNGQGRDFCQAGLNKLVLSSEKCLNRFGD